MSILYKVNGERTICAPANSTNYTLDELQGYVGGLIEIIHLHNDLVMVVNEEGFIRQLPLNDKASEMANKPILGDVLVCNTTEIK